MTSGDLYRRLCLAMGGAVLVAGLSGPASAALFTYSFEMTDGPVLGTVTGTIDLPFVAVGGSGSGPASSVTIDSYPAGIGVLPQGTTATSWTTQLLNDFDVVNGAIVDYAFAALDGPGGLDDYELCFNSGPPAAIGDRVCPTNLNFLGLGGATNYGFNFDGPSGITFIAQGQRVPEPSTLALLGAALATLARLRRRRVA